MSESLQAQSADVAYGAMNTSRLGGGTLIAVIGAGVKALIGNISILGKDGIVAAITVAYDRLTSGDNPWLPGTNTEPDSIEARVEKLGRDSIPTIVGALLTLLL